MTQEWIIDVLSDLRQCAQNNRYPGLIEVLDDAIIIAAAEIRERGEIGGLSHEYTKTRDVHRGAE